MKPAMWMAGCVLSFAFMAIGARELSQSIGTFQILLFRSVIGLAVVLLILVASRRLDRIRTDRISLHVTRNLFHFFGQYGWFLGIGLLPLADVFALEFTVPIWTLIIAVFVLQETMNRRKIFALILGVIGVAIILKPSAKLVDPAAIVALGAAACYAISHISTKSLSSSESPLTILFYMAAVQLPVALLLMGNDWIVPHGVDLFWLVVVGITALTAHYCIVRAMRLADASIVVTLDFMRLPFIGLVGVLFYNEGFDFSLVVGAALMLLANLTNLSAPQTVNARAGA